MATHSTDAFAIRKISEPPGTSRGRWKSNRARPSRDTWVDRLRDAGVHRRTVAWPASDTPSPRIR